MSDDARVPTANFMADIVQIDPAPDPGPRDYAWTTTPDGCCQTLILDNLIVLRPIRCLWRVTMTPPFPHAKSGTCTLAGYFTGPEGGTSAVSVTVDGQESEPQQFYKGAENVAWEASFPFTLPPHAKSFDVVLSVVMHSPDPDLGDGFQIDSMNFGLKDR